MGTQGLAHTIHRHDHHCGWDNSILPVAHAKPGDALKVGLREFQPSGFGWTAIIPGFGRLADRFTEPKLNLWTYDKTASALAIFGAGARNAPSRSERL